MDRLIPPEDLASLLAGYILGDLSPEEAETVVQLLAAQPDLLHDIAQLQETLADIPYALPDVAPPPQLRQSALSALAAEMDAAAIAISPPDGIPGAAITTPVTMPTTTPVTARASQAAAKNPWPGRRALFAMVGSIAAVTVASLGMDNLQLRQKISQIALVENYLSQTRNHLEVVQAEAAETKAQLQTAATQALQQKDLIDRLRVAKTRVIALKGSNQVAAASGNLVVTPGQTKAILVLQNLPAPPTGKFYLLWSEQAGKKVATGKIDPDPEGRVFTKLPFYTPANAKTVVPDLFVTVEVTPSPKQPSGPMVMASSRL